MRYLMSPVDFWSQVVDDVERMKYVCRYIHTHILFLHWILLVEVRFVCAIVAPFMRRLMEVDFQDAKGLYQLSSTLAVNAPFMYVTIF
jgi:hypothetical protein